MTDLPSVETLPPSLARIAGIAGVEAALRIAEAEGGRYMALPPEDRLDKDHWLAKLIGLKPAGKLCRLFVSDGSEVVSIRIERADRSTRTSDWGAPLPGILQIIASLAGTDAALKVGAKRRGTRLYLPDPARLHQGHWLVELLGYPAALRICRVLARDGRDVPQGEAGRQARLKPGAHPLDEHLIAGLSLSVSAHLAGFDRSTARRRRVYLRAKGAL